MWRPPSCVNVAGVVVTIFAILCCVLLMTPTRNGTRGGGLVQPLVIVEETATEFHAAMVYVLPESGVVDAAALSLAFRHILGLAGRPDIVVVGAAAAVAIITVGIRDSFTTSSRTIVTSAGHFSGLLN